MKQWIIYLSCLFAATVTYPQDTIHTFLRLSADNDALIPTNNATDWGYTSGIRVDLFHSSPTLRGYFQGFNVYDHNDRFNTAGWGIMQKIYAPKKTNLAIPDKNDYPYSGALFLIRSFHSSYSKRKLNVLSECVAGIMGPASLGEQTHRFFHRLIKDPAPMGWDHQLPTDLLLNFNLQAEKFLTGSKNVGLIGTSQVRCGTMNDDLSVGLQLQLGSTENYFKGLTNQSFAKNKPKFFFSIKTSADLILYNALLQGGLLNKRSPVHDMNSTSGTDRKLNHLRGNAEIFFLFSLKKFAVSASQKFSTSELKNYGSHSFGNISVYKTL
ncbi:MAG: lipid A deacylase LpxR family protein [Chitinophagaceae bacterium]|nr:lipid A deacylase LpxR family protein [Chitinophagaceae bacterium]